MLGFFLEQKPWWKKYKDMDIINFIIHNVQTRSLEYMYGFDELFTKIESKRYIFIVEKLQMISIDNN